MRIVEEKISILKEVLILTNQRAIFWENQKTLMLSDIHIGKTAHFRKSGIPIPNMVLERDLKRLKTVIDYFKPIRIIIVGDLFHAGSNNDLDTFEAWLQSFKSLEWILVKGNHDLISTKYKERFQLNILNSFLDIEPFRFVHDIKEVDSELFTISGHIHPGVFLEGKGKQRLKLPCYQLSDKQIILPAFSLFTGLNTREQPKNCKCYAFTDTAIFRI